MLLDAGPVSTDEQVGSVIGRYVIEKELLPPNLPRPPPPPSVSPKWEIRF